MCIGVPLKITQSGEFVSKAVGRNGEEEVNMMLIGQQPEGTWILSFLGTAREVLTETDAEQINSALDGLEEVMKGNDIDVDHYFPDMPGAAPKAVN